MELADDGDVF
jgi:NIMA (never in mitosis gene a)-related kinase 1/4/5